MPAKPVIAFPIHDPEGIILPHLQKVIPILKDNFNQAFVGITPVTLKKQKGKVQKIIDDSFFNITYYKEASLIGDHFTQLYQTVVRSCPLKTTVHLAGADRISFILGTEFKDTTLKDFRLANSVSNPVLFHRSKEAWKTHPGNYFAVESMITEVGKILFGRNLDYAWCHFVMKVSDLKYSLPQIQNHNLTIFAELVFHLRKKVKIKDVDWLEWEDPFILGKNPVKYKLEREKSQEENDKRLSYAIPMIQMLIEQYLLLKQDQTSKN